MELENLAATEKFAVEFSEKLRPGDVVFLLGNLGAGKTTFTRFLLRALGVDSVVKSPTYSIVESYDSKVARLHHFDLYRIEDASELDAMGIRDFFNGEDVCVIEWPERLQGAVAANWEINLEMASAPDTRIVTIVAKTAS